MNVETWGEAGEPVLLLHGALSTVEQNYRMVLGPLSARHRLVGVDFRGHGKSPNPDGLFTLDALVSDVLRVLDERGLARVHVLGTSLGGYTALALRARAPERVATLGLAGVMTGWTPEHAAARFDFFKPESVLRAYPHWDKYLSELHADWRGLTHHIGTLLRGLPDEPAVSTAALAADRDRLPLFYVLGDHDEMVPLSAVPAVGEARPDAQIMVVPRAGHLFREYEPTVFSAGYLAFLRRNRMER